jgi:hypothetical protein
MSVEEKPQAPGVEGSKFKLNLNLNFLGNKKEASLVDLADTLKSVNYRYDFPQGLTEEKKKSLKRFDIFR